MFKTPKQEHTAEFKDLAVKRVLSGQSLAAVAKALGLVEQTLPNWSKGGESRQAPSPVPCFWDHPNGPEKFRLFRTIRSQSPRASRRLSRANSAV